jgi:hypothetical protein
MKAYKGFYRNLKCRDFQYTEGGGYETDKAKLCESGFHACENPLDCLNYYSPRALGCWLVLTERDDEGHILGVQAVKVDGESIKADTWYELRGGKVVEAKKED